MCCHYCLPVNVHEVIDKRSDKGKGGEELLCHKYENKNIFCFLLFCF